MTAGGTWNVAFGYDGLGNRESMMGGRGGRTELALEGTGTEPPFAERGNRDGDDARKT